MENVDEWLKVINDTIDDLKTRLEQFQIRKSTNQKSSSERVPSDMDFSDKLGFTAPIMIPDCDVSMCQVCAKGPDQ